MPVFLTDDVYKCVHHMGTSTLDMIIRAQLPVVITIYMETLLSTKSLLFQLRKKSVLDLYILTDERATFNAVLNPGQYNTIRETVGE